MNWGAIGEIIWPFAVIPIGFVLIALAEWFDRDATPKWKISLQLWLHERRPKRQRK